MRKFLIPLCAVILLAVIAFVIFVPNDSAVVAPITSTSIVPEPEARDAFTLLFAGDIMLARSVQKQIEANQDPLYPFLRIADTLRSADLTFANLEGPISARGKNQGSIYSFRFEPVGTKSALQFAGFDVVSIANNHIWDWGSEALSDTITHLNEAGIGHAGAGSNYEEANRPFIATVDGTKLALLAYTNLYPRSLEATSSSMGISSYRLASTSEQIKILKESGQADLVIVSFHWGVEYESFSTSSQQAIARGLIDSGADLIIGHHPHVVQEIEVYQGKFIVYSLGNFVFDQNLSRITMKGLMVRVTVSDKKIESLEEIPVQLTPTFQPYIPGQPGDPTLEVIQ